MVTWVTKNLRLTILRLQFDMLIHIKYISFINHYICVTSWQYLNGQLARN